MTATRYTIIGRRWRDSDGNTYHTAEVRGDGGKLILRTEREYGYWDQFVVTGLDAMERAGLIDSGDLVAYRSCGLSSLGIDSESYDVARRRDLLDPVGVA